jgi:hypothetical protein
MKYISNWFVAVLATAFVATGCSMSTSPDTPSTANDVRPYYVKLATPNVQYRYTENAVAEYHPAVPSELTMDMQGVSKDAYNGKQLYTCMWSYSNYGTPTPWYYTLDQDQAVDLGVEEFGKPGEYNDYWVDLQAPLKEGNSWTFVSMGEKITATITKFGATAKVQGTTYNDVMMVEYNGANGSHVIEWFAKDKGLIYSNYSRPNIGSVVNELKSIEQK